MTTMDRGAINGYGLEMCNAGLNINGIESIQFQLGRIATSDVYIATAYFYNQTD